MIKASPLESFPPNENPFTHDIERMGVRLGVNVMAMMMNHDTAKCSHLVLVNTVTGERIGVEFAD